VFEAYSTQGINFNWTDRISNKELHGDVPRVSATLRENVRGHNYGNKNENSCLAGGVLGAATWEKITRRPTA